MRRVASGFGEIVWLQKPVDMVVGFGIIIRAHVGEKKLSCDLAGFFLRGIGVARDEDERIVAGHLYDISTLISILTRCSLGRVQSYVQDRFNIRKLAAITLLAHTSEQA